MVTKSDKADPCAKHAQGGIKNSYKRETQCGQNGLEGIRRQKNLGTASQQLRGIPRQKDANKDPT